MAEWLCSGLQLRLHRFDSVLSLQTKMKIIVSGCAGFIGYHLCNRLLNNGHEVVGIDNLDDYYDANLKILRLEKLKKFNSFYFKNSDINTLVKLKKKIDVYINLAAQAAVRLDSSKKFKYEHSNIEGFKGMLKTCSFNKIKKIIYASSSSVYSGNSKSPFSEQDTLNAPTSFYAATKIQNEKMAEKYVIRNNSKMIGLRFFTVYGPLGRPDMAYYLFSKNILNNRQINLFNNGNTSRDMTYIDDVVDGIMQSIIRINNSNMKHEIFNLGNTKPIKTKDLVLKIENLLQKKAIINNVFVENEVNTTNADISKSRNILLYNPKIDLDYGLTAFMKWFKNYYNVQ